MIIPGADMIRLNLLLLIVKVLTIAVLLMLAISFAGGSLGYGDCLGITAMFACSYIVWGTEYTYQ